MIAFTTDNVLSYFSDSTIKKAIPYAKKAVLASHWQGNELIALVDGSDFEPYNVSVTVTRNTQNMMSFDTDCTCPVGYRCKHAVALLLHEAQAQQIASAKVSQLTQPTQNTSKTTKAVLQAVNRYFENIYNITQRQLAQLPTEIAPKSEGMLFLIKMGAIFTDITPIKVRRLKGGELSSNYSPASTWSNFITGYGRMPAYCDTFDLELLHLLFAAKESYTHNVILKGELGEVIVRKLLIHNKLVAEVHQQLVPVVALEPCELQLSWQSVKNDAWQLTHNLAISGEFRLVETTPPYVLGFDVDGQCAYLTPIVSPLPTALLVALLHKPVAIPSQQLFDLWQPLLEIYPALPSLPASLLPNRLQILPVPVLQLAQLNADTVTYLPAPVIAKLSIRYDGFYFRPEQSENHKTEIVEDALGHRLMVERDFAQEAKAVYALLDMGLDWHDMDASQKDAMLLVPQPQRHSVEVKPYHWLPYLEQLNLLRELGWQVTIDLPSLNNIQVSDGVSVNLLDDEGDFALDATLSTVEGELPLLPLIHEYLAQDKPLPDQGEIYLEKPDGGFVRIDVAQLAPIFQTITELYDRPLNSDGQLKLSQYDVMGLNSQQVKVKGQKAQAIRRMVSQLATISGIDPVEPPQNLKATLRDYQQLGFNWLQFITQHQLGGILADDMGLGKTLQVISHLLKLHEQGQLSKPALVVAPTSVVGNWMAELKKFAPSLRAIRFDGSERKQLQSSLTEAQVIVTSFSLLQRDAEFWHTVPLHSLIIDEAQYVKNSKAKTAQVIRELNCEHRLCLTGTPMENHLGELWSLFDFVIPGFLTDERTFKKRYRNPIEQHGDQDCQQRLSQRVSPFMLRRTKADVVQELPPKTEVVQRVTLDKAQWQLYSSVRLSMEKRVRELMAEKGLKRSHIEILDALLKLRQACCDPRLLKIPAAEKVKHSAKLEALVEMVSELVAEGRKILVFSQFATMLGLIEDALHQATITTSKLTGQTRKRQDAIDAFTQGKADVFLISLKAGGVGLNLTVADTVIHYDPWWNPAVEAQATDRAYRIGQDKPVFVYKLIAENTVEEKILQMQEKKRALADSLFSDEDALSVWTDAQTILGLFSEQQ